MLQSKDYDIHEDVSLEQENYQRIKKHPLIWPWTKFQHHIRFPYTKTKLRQTRTKNQKLYYKTCTTSTGVWTPKQIYLAYLWLTRKITASSSELSSSPSTSRDCRAFTSSQTVNTKLHQKDQHHSKGCKFYTWWSWK